MHKLPRGSVTRRFVDYISCCAALIESQGRRDQPRVAHADEREPSRPRSEGLLFAQVKRHDGRIRLDEAAQSGFPPRSHLLTCLAVDVADAVNLMLWSAPIDGDSGYAAWDMFHRDDAPRVRDLFDLIAR